MRRIEKIDDEARFSLIKVRNCLESKEKSDSCTFRTKTRQIIPCSVKPISCIIPRDINLKELYIQLFNSSFSLYNNKKIYCKLSPEQIIERKNVIESIKKFINVHRIKYKLLYNIIYMFDILICYSQKNNLILNLEKLGLGSSILTIKFTYEEYMMIPFNKFKTFYDDKNYTINQLQEIEINCLKLINYYLSFPTPLSFMELLLLNGVVFSTDNVKNEICQKIYNMLLLTLEKIMLISNEYIKYSPLYLSCSIVAYCRECFGIEKWPKVLSKVFDVNQKNFESINKEFFATYNHYHTKSSININDKLINKRFPLKLNANKYLLSEKERNECLENNLEKNNNDINVNSINKDIKITQENNEIKEPNKNIDNNHLKENSNILNIRVNFKTSQEIRNSALFRKMCNKYSKKMNKSKNETNISNLNMQSSNEIGSTIATEERKVSHFNYDINKYTKSINSSKKPLINIYKTPIKFDAGLESSCFYKPNNKKSIEYNHFCQKNIKTNTNENQNKPTTINKDESELNYYIDSKNNIYSNNNKSIDIYKNDKKKYNNKTIDEIKPKINLNEKEEIKVRVKEFYDNNSNNELIIKKQKSYFNQFISTESNYIFNNNNKNLNENNKESIQTKNNDSCITIKEPYKNNILWKNLRTSIKNANFKSNNIDLPSKKECSYFNEIKNNKKVGIIRHSSCNDKFKNIQNNKEDDYSNETTSENSHNISIRRNYFQLKRLRDKSINNLNNDNTTLTNNNLTNNNNKINNKSISVVKCDLYNNNINNGVKSSKLKDCLRIGFGSIEKRIYIKNIEKQKEKENEKENDKNKLIERIKRYGDIRTFYKLKNVNKNPEEINEKNKEKNSNIS